ncbi:MAG: hypothetical protein OEZ58_17220, partial [Gammaproteobacteria bacterium]|nr:hypothetical protein [Gammaproteobacteria bacterium]
MLKQYLGKIYLAGLFVLIAAGVTLVVQAALSPSQLFKLNPHTIETQPGSSLSSETKQLELDTINNLIDGDVTTEYTVYDESTVTIEFKKEIQLAQFKLFAAAPNIVNVQKRQRGVWETVNAWQSLDLSGLDSVWSVYQLEEAVEADAIRFEFLPKTAKGNKQNQPTGLKEIEIWAQGERSVIAGFSQLLDAIENEKTPAQISVLMATPEQGVIGPLELPPSSPFLPDDDSDNQFIFTITQPVHTITRAWLHYQLHGLSHWVSTVRTINGKATQGGQLLFVDNNWSEQTEVVNPQWLVEGENTILFAVPEGEHGNYGVRDVQLILEFENGANFVQRIEADNSSESNSTDQLMDSDTGKGWRPYAGSIGRNTKPSVAFYFHKTLQLDAFRFYLEGNLDGSISFDYYDQGSWRQISRSGMQGRKLSSGWNEVTLSSDFMQAIRMTFSGDAGSAASINEVELLGSAVGAQARNQLNITYPLDGVYYGRTAVIRGYLNLADNDSGPADIFISGLQVNQDSGAFELKLSKNDIGLRSQRNSDDWSVEVKAVYPDGETLTETVILNNHKSDSLSDNRLLMLYAMMIGAGSEQTLQYDEAILDIGSGAVDGETTIGIQSLDMKDLPPLDPGMTNVTKGPRKGYRFTPHPMKFKKHIKVKLPFDESKLPKGLTADDIKTFYFDENSGHWKPLDRINIDARGQMIVSHTNHFTDMINATIVVPEHPQLANFNPTSIKDIKAADPSANIALIEPPKANNMGDARLSYPIQVPPGRAGMQPQLSISYNSGGGNGWLGLGWDLSTPSISVDTRWGVPNYHADWETETYMLQGAMLAPVAHRGDLEARSSNKQFYPRVEGEFQTIKRHGNNTTNYWWEVTDKSGKRFFYGGQLGAGVIESKVLKTSTGHIAKWFLNKVVDTNDNAMTYDYETVIDNGAIGDPTQGKQIYLKEIRYTDDENQIGVFTVLFNLDKDRPNYVKRNDVSIDLRAGFKQVTANLLKQILVNYNGATVYQYDLQYTSGAFNKTLLEALIQKDKDGVELAQHEFDYNNFVQTSTGQYDGFSSSSSAYQSNSEGGNIVGKIASRVSSSMLSGNLGSSKGGSLYLGGTWGANKKNSAGGNISISTSKSNTRLMLSDINGDNLPDKVYVRGSNVYFQAMNINGSFQEERRVEGISLLSNEKTYNRSWGGQVFFSGLTGQTTSMKSTVTQDVYMSDVNGDGLVDLVNKGRVYFNRIEAGIPKFEADSRRTPVPMRVNPDSVAEGFPDFSTIKNEILQK